MAYDVKGEELKEGDEVVLRAKVVKAVPDTDYVTVETLVPENRPERMTTISTKGFHLEKVVK